MVDPLHCPRDRTTGQALGSGESSSKYLKAVDGCRIFLVDSHRFCPGNNRQNTHLLPTPGDLFSWLFLWWLLLFVLYISMDSGGQWANAGFAGPLWFWGRWNDCKGCFIHVQTASHSWSDSLPAMTGFPYQWLWAIPDQLLPTSKPGKLCFIFFSTRKVSCQEIFRCKTWGEEGLLEWGKSARWPLAELGTLVQLRQRAFAAILQPAGWWHPKGSGWFLQSMQYD